MLPEVEMLYYPGDEDTGLYADGGEGFSGVRDVAGEGNLGIEIVDGEQGEVQSIEDGGVSDELDRLLIFYPGRADGNSYEEVMCLADEFLRGIELGIYSNPEVVSRHIEKLLDFAIRSFEGEQL